MTVRVRDADAGFWTGVRSFRIDPPHGGPGRRYDVETSRAYRDRLVLKLRGVDDPSAAEGLRGHQVLAESGEVPALGENEYYRSRLVGLAVHDETGRLLGRVEDVQPTGGADLLRVRRDDREAEELLIPLAEEIVLKIDEEEGRIDVRLPKGLEELNRGNGPGRE